MHIFVYRGRWLRGPGEKKADNYLQVLVTNTNIYKVKSDNSGSVQYLK